MRDETKGNIHCTRLEHRCKEEANFATEVYLVCLSTLVEKEGCSFSVSPTLWHKPLVSQYKLIRWLTKSSVVYHCGTVSPTTHYYQPRSFTSIGTTMTTKIRISMIHMHSCTIESL